MRPRPPNRTGFISSVWLDKSKIPSVHAFPFNLPAFRSLKRLKFHPAVTFFAGENGSGKSTLIEAIAVRMGFDELGGTGYINRFLTRDLDGGLHDALMVDQNFRRPPADRFFLRAETVFDFATNLDEARKSDARAYENYGKISLHSRSHGEAFLSIIQNRLAPESLIIMDEPEAALSPLRQLTFMKEVDWLVRSGSQLVIATHSPMLMTYPDSWLYYLDEEGFHLTSAEETEHFQLTKNFLNRPEAYLRHLVE